MKKLCLYLNFTPTTLQAGDELQQMSRQRIFTVVRVVADAVVLRDKRGGEFNVELTDLEDFRRLTLVDVATFDGGECPAVDENSKVSVADFNRLAKERDGAFDEVHRLRNFIQALYAKETGFKRTLEGALHDQDHENGDKIRAADIQAFAAQADKEFQRNVRKCAADQVAENFDYAALGYWYEDDSGWEYDNVGNVWKKPVFLYPICSPSTLEDTVKKTLTVEFSDDLIFPIKSITLI